MTGAAKLFLLAAVAMAFGEPALQMGAMGITLGIGAWVFAAVSLSNDDPVTGRLALFASGMLIIWRQWTQGADYGLTHGKYLPWLILLAWVATRSRPKGSFVEMASGFAAACYAMAGLAKLLGAGLAWGRAGSLAMLVRERSYGDSVLATFRRAVSEFPIVVELAGWLALGIELAGVALLFPRLRVGYTIVVIAMHQSIGLLLGYYYWDWSAAMIALALSARARARDPLETSAHG